MCAPRCEFQRRIYGHSVSQSKSCAWACMFVRKGCTVAWMQCNTNFGCEPLANIRLATLVSSFMSTKLASYLADIIRGIEKPVWLLKPLEQWFRITSTESLPSRSDHILHDPNTHNHVTIRDIYKQLSRRYHVLVRPGRPKERRQLHFFATCSTNRNTEAMRGHKTFAPWQFIQFELDHISAC